MAGIMLLWGGFNFADFLNQLADMGFFTYVLPFLLIFAVVYAILSLIPTFNNNKGAAVLVAVAVGLLALQPNYVPAFFQTFFPEVGIGISILLVAMILVGAFIPFHDPNKNPAKWIIFATGVLIFLVITFSSLSDWNFIGSNWWEQYGALAIVIVVIVGSIVGVIIASKESTPP